MSPNLSKFSSFTTIVADTTDISSIKTYQPQDATTNPTLILKSATTKEWDSHIEIPALGENLIQETGVNKQDILYCEAAVLMGIKILELIPGRISTEVPSRYSFDSSRTIALAKYIVSRYTEKGISSERILIKIAATWEGIESARILKKEGIHCNITLLFSLTQAIACAQAGVKLISPFVGRVYDWHKQQGETITPDNDPGVKLVSDIYSYYKKFDYPVEIMGASFRNLEQVLSLTGCDLLTISPTLLAELDSYTGEITPQLDPKNAKTTSWVKRSIDRETFMWELCANTMAFEKLAEGIRLFHQDFLKLNNLFYKN